MAFPLQDGRPPRSATAYVEDDYSQQQLHWTQGYDQYGQDTDGRQYSERSNGAQHSAWDISAQRPETATGYMQPSTRQGLSSPSSERHGMYQSQQQHHSYESPAPSKNYGEVHTLDLPSRPNTAPRSPAWERPSMRGDMYNASHPPQKGYALGSNNFYDSNLPKEYSVPLASPSGGQTSPNIRQPYANPQRPVMGRRPPPGRIDASAPSPGAPWPKPSHSPHTTRDLHGVYADSSSSQGRAQAHGPSRIPQHKPSNPRVHQGNPRNARREATSHNPTNGRAGPHGPSSGPNGHGDRRDLRENASYNRERGRPNPDMFEGIPPSVRRPSPNQTDPKGPSFVSNGSAQRKEYNPPRPATAAGTRADNTSGRGTKQAEDVGRNGRRLSDTLPSHPTPIRPGLMQGETLSQPTTRSQNVQQDSTQFGASSASQITDPGNKQQSTAVTHEELDRLRQEAVQRPADQILRMQLAKKLVEAARTLADEGGQADTRSRNKNREKFVGESHQIVKKLVAENFAEAQFYLADCLGSGVLGIPNDSKEAFLLYQQAAKAGHAQAAYRTAVCCEIGPEDGGGTRKDTLKAFQWYKRAAALGDQPSMYKVGMIQLKGLLGQEINAAEAVTWLKRAVEFADEQNPHAMHELGTLYDSQSSQRLITPDDTKALDLFTRAANFGFKRSQFKLGQAYEYGTLGCPIDARNSIIWYTRAAAQGEHQSELALSGWYLTGSEGILEHSDVEAYLWARKAALAEPPLAKAMFALGYYTEVGIGCPRSLEEAKKWYSRAAAHQFPKAQERLDELRRGGAKVQKNREHLSRKNQRQQEAECSVM